MYSIGTAPLVIIGNGGFGRELLDLILDINTQVSKLNQSNDPPFMGWTYSILGFLNNDKDSWGQTCNDYPILGDEGWIKSFIDNNPVPEVKLNVAIGIGTPKIKRKIVENLKALYKNKISFPNLVHPNTTIGSKVEFGEGNIITAGNILTCNITVKNHVMINLAGTVGHDVVINDYVVVSPGVNISGNVTIGEEAYLGTGSSILEKKNIGNRSVVGGSALVSKDVPDDVTVVGVPAKPLVRS